MLDKTGELAGISGFFWGADSFKPGTNQYYEKTSVLSQASGLTNSTPNIINATYTDARGRKVGTITYGATASDDITTQFNSEREGFEPNAPICSISVIYKNSFR